jgi:hypothetical protein
VLLVKVVSKYCCTILDKGGAHEHDGIGSVQGRSLCSPKHGGIKQPPRMAPFCLYGLSMPCSSTRDSLTYLV